MRMVPTQFGDALTLDGYGPGFFRVRGQVYHGSIIVTRNELRDWGGLDDLDPLLALAGQVDLLLLGLGQNLIVPPAGVMAKLQQAGFMAEAMTTPSAARSYNVLVAEERAVAVALLTM